MLTKLIVLLCFLSVLQAKPAQDLGTTTPRKINDQVFETVVGVLAFIVLVFVVAGVYTFLSDCIHSNYGIQLWMLPHENAVNLFE